MKFPQVFCQVCQRTRPVNKEGKFFSHFIRPWDSLWGVKGSACPTSGKWAEPPKHVHDFTEWDYSFDQAGLRICKTCHTKEYG